MCSKPAAPDAKRALVTGGTGFVGANLVRRLLAEGHEVGLLVRKGHDPWRLADVSARVHWIEASLEERAALASAVADFRPRWVFHLAAHGAYSWQSDPVSILRTNVLGTANLLDACLAIGFEAFVNAGSSSEYGFKDHPPREDEVLEPTSTYGVAKAASTLYCVQAARAADAPVTTLRLYSVYGPWEEPRRFIPQLVARGLEGRLPPLASPETARDYVFVSDVCEAFVRTARRIREPGSIYNVGTGVQTTLRQAIEVATRVFGITIAPHWGSMRDRGWDTSTWVADRTRIKEDLGWDPSVDLEHGLRLTADWLVGSPSLTDRYRAASS